MNNANVYTKFSDVVRNTYNSLKVTSLKIGTYYYFKVRAKIYSGDDAVYSSY